MIESRTPSNRVRFAALALIAAMAVGGGVWLGFGNAQEQDDPSKEPPIAHAKALSLAFRKAAENAMPSVVTVRTKTKAPTLTSGGGAAAENPFKGTPFEQFFDEETRERFLDQMPRQQAGVGSGVIIDRSGIILTNHHVIQGADEVIVHLPDGRDYKVTDIKSDPQTDLAVLRIEGAEDLPVAKLGDSDDLEIGDWVIAVGNPFELESTVSAGIISGKARDLGTNQRMKYLQTDAAINPGNSGGPLLTLDGEVIGINTAIATNSGGYQGVGFAIPINLAKWVTSQLIKTGSVARAYLGVGIGDVNAELAEKFGVARGGGVLVAEVFPNSPAAEAGIRDGDIITEFAGKKVKNRRELQELVERAPLDSKQTLTIIRDDKTEKVDVTVKVLPAELGQRAETGKDEPKEESAPALTNEELGLDVSELTAEKAKELSLEGFSGVLVSGVEASGVAFEKGLREGMLILKVGKTKVTTVAEFEKALEGESLAKGILLQVRTNGGNQFLVLKG